MGVLLQLDLEHGALHRGALALRHQELLAAGRRRGRGLGTAADDAATVKRLRRLLHALHTPASQSWTGQSVLKDMQREKECAACLNVC